MYGIHTEGSNTPAGATFWEVLITLEDEVRLFWRRGARFSPQCLLLTSTRICMVAYSILQITQFLPQPTCFVCLPFSIRTIDALAYVCCRAEVCFILHRLRAVN